MHIWTYSVYVFSSRIFQQLRTLRFASDLFHISVFRSPVSCIEMCVCEASKCGMYVSALLQVHKYIENLNHAVFRSLSLSFENIENIDT